MNLIRLPEFTTWLAGERPKDCAQVEARLLKITEESYFGDAKDLGEGLAELRWKNGRRVYFSKGKDEHGQTVILILGGNKNGQSKDITRSRKILSQIKE